jgi:hypothetical protein
VRLPAWLHPLLLWGRHWVAVLQGWAKHSGRCDSPAMRAEFHSHDPQFTAPAVFSGALPQPTRTTCGSSVLVVMDLLAGGTPLGPDPEADFSQRARATMRRTNTWRDRRGRPQLPWPDALGTRPAALVRELGGGWTVRVVDPRRPGRAWEALRTAGRPVPLYVGEGSWMQHVVLVLDADEDRMTVYEPARGVVLTRTRRDFETARLDLGGWDQPWLVVLPTARRGATNRR